MNPEWRAPCPPRLSAKERRAQPCDTVEALTADLVDLRLKPQGLVEGVEEEPPEEEGPPQGTEGEGSV